MTIDLVAGVKRGDGVAFDPAGGGDDAAQGGRVYEVFERGVSLTEAVDRGRVDLAFGHWIVDLQAVQHGAGISIGRVVAQGTQEKVGKAMDHPLTVIQVRWGRGALGGQTATHAPSLEFREPRGVGHAHAFFVRVARRGVH